MTVLVKIHKRMPAAQTLDAVLGAVQARQGSPVEIVINRRRFYLPLVDATRLCNSLHNVLTGAKR